ncbi:MAG: hypothetical protein CMC57_06255, partial [Flavobacteriaceae bacterium]|nr:hypothetical protein [Flavobacteriaceae bacterium]
MLFYLKKKLYILIALLFPFFGISQSNIFSNYIQLDGTNDYIKIPSTNDLKFDGDQFTFEAWVKLDTPPPQTSSSGNHTSSDRRYLIEKQDDWSLYFLNIDGNIYLEGRYRVTYAGNWPNVRSSSTIPLNTWTHVAFSFSRSAGKLRVYINGSEVGSTNSNGAMTSTSYPIGLGAGYWGNPRNYIDGAIDEVRLWDVARSQSDINTYKNQSVDGANNLVLYYKLDETSGTTAADSSSNSNNGSLQGGAIWSQTQYSVNTSSTIIETVCAVSDLPASVRNGITAFWPMCSSNPTAEVAAGSYGLSPSNANKFVQNQNLKDKTSGAIATAFYFNGTDSYFGITNGQNNSFDFDGDGSVEDLSVSFWIKNDLPSNHNGSHIWHRANNGLTMGVNSNGWTANIAKQGVEAIAFPGGGDGSSRPLPSGVWTHVSVTKSGTTYKIYFDGQETVSQNYSSALSPSGNLVFGKANGNGGHGGSYFFQGYMTQLMMHNRALTQSEVLSLAATVTTTPSPTLSLTHNHPDTVVSDIDNVRIMANFSGVTASSTVVTPTINISGLVTNTAMTASSSSSWYYDWNVPGNVDVENRPDVSNDGAIVTVSATNSAGESYSFTNSITFTIDNVHPVVHSVSLTSISTNPGASTSTATIEVVFTEDLFASRVSGTSTGTIDVNDFIISINSSSTYLSSSTPTTMSVTNTSATDGKKYTLSFPFNGSFEQGDRLTVNVVSDTYDYAGNNYEMITSSQYSNTLTITTSNATPRINNLDISVSHYSGITHSASSTTSTNTIVVYPGDVVDIGVGFSKSMAPTPTFSLSQNLAVNVPMTSISPTYWKYTWNVSPTAATYPGVVLYASVTATDTNGNALTGLMSSGLNIGDLPITFTLGSSSTYSLSVTPTGAGTAQNPYIIDSFEKLRWISENPNKWDKWYVQTKDIDAHASRSMNDAGTDTLTLEGFSPIGTLTNQFSGNYNGYHHAIYGLYINRPGQDHVGLFGAIAGNPSTSAQSGDVANLFLENVYIKGREFVGSLVGLFGAESDSRGFINNCHANGMVIANTSGGGLIGRQGKNATTKYSSAHVFVSGGQLLGGLVGNTNGNVSNAISLISHSYASGSVSGTQKLGGFVGLIGEHSMIRNSYAMGNVTGSGNNVGGFVGYDESARSDQKGRQYTFSTGRATGVGNNVGGSSGGVDSNSTGSDNFWDTQTSSKTTSGATSGAREIGKTTFELFTRYTYANWANFDQNWIITGNLNHGYPALRYNNMIELEDIAFLPATSQISMTLADPDLDVQASELSLSIISDQNSSVTSYSSVPTNLTTSTMTVGSSTGTLLKFGINITGGYLDGDEVIKISDTSTFTTNQSSSTSSGTTYYDDHYYPIQLTVDTYSMIENTNVYEPTIDGYIFLGDYQGKLFFVSANSSSTIASDTWANQKAKVQTAMSSITSVGTLAVISDTNENNAIGNMIQHFREWYGRDCMTWQQSTTMVGCNPLNASLNQAWIGVYREGNTMKNEYGGLTQSYLPWRSDHPTGSNQNAIMFTQDGTSQGFSSEKNYWTDEGENDSHPAIMELRSFGATENVTSTLTIRESSYQSSNSLLQRIIEVEPNSQETWSVTGPDASSFILQGTQTDSSTNVVLVLPPKDYENPTDTNQDGIYEFELVATYPYNIVKRFQFRIGINDYDENLPNIQHIEITPNNSIIKVHFSEPITSNASGTIANIATGSFNYSISGGTATLTTANPTSVSVSGSVLSLGLSLASSPTGNEILTLGIATNTLYDLQGNVVDSNQTTNTVRLKDQIPPKFTGIYLNQNNSAVAVSFSEPLSASSSGVVSLNANNFRLTINGGTATLNSPTPTSISMMTNNLSSTFAVASGRTIPVSNTFILSFTLSGTINGSEVLTVSPTSTNPDSSGALFDYSANILGPNQVSNTIRLVYRNVPNNVPINGLLAYYPFQNQTANDASGNSNHGTINGGGLTSTNRTASNKAFEFDGSNDYINLPINYSGLPFTISAWFNTDRDNLSLGQSIVDQDIMGKYGNSLILGYPSGDKTIDIQYHNGSYNSPKQYNVNQWMHAIALFESGKVSLYVDGVFIGSKTFNQGGNEGGNYRIGLHNNTHPRWFDGEIDDVALWDRLLTSEEIKRLSPPVITEVSIVPKDMHPATTASNTVKHTVKVKFSKSVSGSSSNTNANLSPNNFSLSVSSTNSITISSPLSINGDGDTYFIDFNVLGITTGSETLTVSVVSNTIFDGFGNPASTDQSTNTTNLLNTPPYLLSTSIDTNNSYVEVRFNENIYSGTVSSGLSTPTVSNFRIVDDNSNTISSTTPISVLASTTLGVYRLGLSLKVTPTGGERLSVSPHPNTPPVDDKGAPWRLLGSTSN